MRALRPHPMGRLHKPNERAPMISVLALAFLATSAPTTGYTSWVKNGEAHVRFYDLSRIYGPFKFYVSANGCPDAGCATCPSGSGITADYVVPSDKVYQ